MAILRLSNKIKEMAFKWFKLIIDYKFKKNAALIKWKSIFFKCSILALFSK